MTLMYPLFLSAGGARLKLKMLNTPLETHPSLKTSKSKANILKPKNNKHSVSKKKCSVRPGKTFVQKGEKQCLGVKETEEGGNTTGTGRQTAQGERDEGVEGGSCPVCT